MIVHFEVEWTPNSVPDLRTAGTATTKHGDAIAMDTLDDHLEEEDGDAGTTSEDTLVLHLHG